MPSYDYEYYTCPKCKARRTTKTCPDCAAKTKGQGRVSMRYRLINEYGEKRNMRTGWYDRKSDAEDEYTKVKATAPKVDYRTRDGESYLFEDLLIKYLQEYSIDRAEASQYELSRLSKKYWLPDFGKTDIRKITKQMLMEWQTKLLMPRNDIKGKGKNVCQLSNIYVAKIRRDLNAFFKWVSYKYDIPNPLQAVAPIKAKRNKKIKEFLELSEFEPLDKASESDILWNTIFCFLMHTGCRVGEVQALYESDYKNGVLTISKTVSKDKNARAHISHMPKNKKPYSKPLDNFIIAKLNKYLEWKRENGISDKYLFGGDDFIDIHYFARKLKFYLNKSKIEKNITPHSFRHGYVSMLIHMDCTTKTVAEMIGDTEEVVSRTYSHLYTEKKQQIVDKLNAFLVQK